MAAKIMCQTLKQPLVFLWILEMPQVSSCLNADDQKGQGFLSQKQSESLMQRKCSFVYKMDAK